jgi:hypothetical protein
METQLPAQLLNLHKRTLYQQPTTNILHRITNVFNCDMFSINKTELTYRRC